MYDYWSQELLRKMLRFTVFSLSVRLEKLNYLKHALKLMCKRVISSLLCSFRVPSLRLCNHPNVPHPSYLSRSKYNKENKNFVKKMSKIVLIHE